MMVLVARASSGRRPLAVCCFITLTAHDLKRSHFCGMSCCRWGIASTANVNRHILAAAEASSRSCISAVASRSNERASRYAAEKQIPLWFGSYDAMFQSADVDCVYVSVPNAQHAEVAMAAMSHGKHVLCEKPLATSVADAEAMFQCARDNGVTLTEACMNLHARQLKTAKELLASGVIGDVIAMRGHWTLTGGPSGGGAVWGLGSYVVNTARFLSGAEPIAVSCTASRWWSAAPELGGEAFSAASLAFPTFHLTMECGAMGPPSTAFEVIGSRGSLSFEAPFKPSVRGSRLFLRTQSSKDIGLWCTEAIVVSEEDHVAHLYQLELDELSSIAAAARTKQETMAIVDGTGSCTESHATVSSCAPPPATLLSAQFSINGVRVLEAMHGSMMCGGRLMAL